MKVTIRYMDDSVSTLEIDGDELSLGSNEEYFTIEDSDEVVMGWIVRANVKYVIMGELIDKFQDGNVKDDRDRDDRVRREY